jgi:hypothetical protein
MPRTFDEQFGAKISAPHSEEHRSESFRPDTTYIVTRQAATGFSGAGTLKADAINEAARFCEARGKILKVVAVTEAHPPYILGNFPKAEVVFKALSPGNPELDRQSEYDSSGTQIRVGSSLVNRSEVKMSVDRQEAGDIYANLEKLDELRKKGILSEDEFQKEKTRLLGAQK